MFGRQRGGHFRLVQYGCVLWGENGVVQGDPERMYPVEVLRF